MSSGGGRVCGEGPGGRGVRRWEGAEHRRGGGSRRPTPSERSRGASPPQHCRSTGAASARTREAAHKEGADGLVLGRRELRPARRARQQLLRHWVVHAIVPAAGGTNAQGGVSWQQGGQPAGQRGRTGSRRSRRPARGPRAKQRRRRLQQLLAAGRGTHRSLMFWSVRGPAGGGSRAAEGGEGVGRCTGSSAKATAAAAPEQRQPRGAAPAVGISWR